MWVVFFFFCTLLHLFYQQVLPSPADLFSISPATAILPTTILTPACQILQWLPITLSLTLNSLPWSTSPTGSGHCPFLWLSLVISHHIYPSSVSLSSCLYLNIKPNVFPSWFGFWHSWVNGVMGRYESLKREQTWEGKVENEEYILAIKFEIPITYQSRNVE